MPNWAAVFDWDGVVVDSQFAHERSWVLLAEEEGLPLPDNHFHRGFGMRNEIIIPQLLQWTDDPDRIRSLSLRKEEWYREVLTESGLVALPGVMEWLDRLDAEGVPRIIASSTQRKNIEFGLRAVGLGDRFDQCVTSEDVSHGKPDPDVFLLAAKRIGVSPERCVVIEDTPVGITAGKRAGMRVIAVETTHGEDKLGEADWITPRLDAMPSEVPAGWFAAE